ncbi:MAG: hypothetical protein LBR60_01755 [Fibrobacter sp.]|jgi:hypothetical protein|nr:hypothetical protein [Fibrobacter sp.]
MLKKLIPLFSLLTFFGCSDSGSGSDSKSTVSCDMEGFMCTEMSAVDGAKDACESGNGTFGSSCPSGFTAKCTDNTDGISSTIYWYIPGASCNGDILIESSDDSDPSVSSSSQITDSAPGKIPSCELVAEGIFGTRSCVAGIKKSECNTMNMPSYGVTATYKANGCDADGITATCLEDGITVYYYDEGASCM